MTLQEINKIWTAGYNAGLADGKRFGFADGLMEGIEPVEAENAACEACGLFAAEINSDYCKGCQPLPETPELENAVSKLETRWTSKRSKIFV